MFKGKVALVTGSAKGIGAATIKLLASRNCNVIIHYNNSKDEAINLKKYIDKNYNVKCEIVKFDLTNEDQIKTSTDYIIDKFGKIDILVNNASLEITSDFNLKTKIDFKKIIDTNLIGTFLLSKEVSKYMLKNKYGKIINVTSNNAINKYDPITLEYDASKAGIISLTHNFAVEFAPYINVNAVAPGWVMTENVDNLNNSLDGILEIEESKNILMNRFAKPEEIAKLIVFLASDDSSYINNEVIKIDGGTR